MTGKSDQATREQRGNLGQKEAERQKESESQMRQMGEATAKQQSGSAAHKQSKS
jgi:hypothetical protein